MTEKIHTRDLEREPVYSGEMKVVGVLANATGDPYLAHLMHAVATSLVKEGVHATGVMGGFPHAPIYRDASERVALPPAIDGWVVLSATLRFSASELQALLGTSRPCVSVGLELPSTPSITASDEAGVLQAVAHLSRRHGRRRIAFIAGPSTSVDAERRLAAYHLALESVGLPADPTLIASGDYEPRSGREAVKQLKRQARRFDALVAANDLMAIGAIEGLQANGHRVPEDISVIGFDDLEEASFSAPTLTTVRQPLKDLGARAARLIIDQLEGKSVELHTPVTAPLVIRQSCGCRSEGDGKERRSLSPASEPNPTEGLRENALRELLRRELAHARTARELGNLSDGILGASDYTELAAVLTEVRRLLGIRRLVLASYSSGQRHARVTLESSGERVVFQQHAESHALEELLAPGFLRDDRPAHLCVQTLELGGEELGYLMLEGDGRNEPFYLDLRRLLSGAVARITQGRELRRLYAAEKKRS